MRILADENVANQFVLRLRAESHSVDYIHEVVGGSDDDLVLALANAAGQILLTDAKDFGELIFRRRLPATDVIPVLLASLPNDQQALTIAQVIDEHAAELTDAFAVISPRAVRMRRQPA